MFLIALSALVAITSGAFTDRLSTPDIIKYHGYPVEEHVVETDDGYLNTVFRIPYGRDPRTIANEKTRPVVFMMHGLFSDSNNYILNMPSQSAGFVFADAGFDVWLGNSRGTMFGLNHTELTPFNNQFWDFSFYEIGILDVASQIDYVLNVTDQTSLYHMGHSQGTITFFILLSERPEYNDKIRMGFEMGPAAGFAHVPLYIKIFVRTVYDIGEEINKKVHNMPVLLPKFARGILGDLCRLPLISKGCELTGDLILGFESSTQLNSTRLGLFLKHFPTSTSLRNLLHYGQLIDHGGQLRQFDYGYERNVKQYGASSAPKFDLSKVTTKVHLIWSDEDNLTTGKDVREWLLPNLPNAVSHHVFTFSHLDFAIGLRAADTIYKPTIETIYEDLEQRRTRSDRS